MAITGAVGAALRQDAPYQAEIQMGAQLIMDFQGARSGRRPYYWYRGTRYARLEKIPGWSFSRNSAGTAEDLAGNVIQFPANEPRITDRGLLIEEARTQIARNNRFQDWTGIAPNGYSAPVPSRIAKSAGVLGANSLKLLGPFVNDGNRIGLAAMPEIVGSTVYTFTARVRKTRGTTAELALAIDSWGSTAFVLDLSSAPIGQWVTVSQTNTSPASPSNSGGISTNGRDCDFEIDWWQFEAGPARTSVIVNDTLGAATRAADSAYIAGLGVILGQFRTNLLSYSRAFSSPPWAKQNCTANDNVATGPDGTVSASKVVESTAPSSHVVIQQPSSTFANTTFSVYAKKGERSWAIVYFGSYTAGAAWFDLNAGVVGTVEASVAASIVDVGGGWYRLSIRQTTANAAVSVAFGPAATNGTGSYQGDGTSGVYFADAQLEIGSTATANILSGAAATSVGSPVTLVAWADLPAADAVNRALFTASDGGNINRVDIRRSASNGSGAVVLVGGITMAAPSAPGTFAGAQIIKSSLRMRGADGRMVTNGAYGTATQTAWPLMNRIDLGCFVSAGGNFLNGYFRGFIVANDVDDTQLGRTAT